ncbi:hypothetical protein FZ103_18930 [Streptomonospora sp. PA3]|uniref:hypothetical protein n=1 Tax=Streptomonospora sp. PA3 TaxID=2607326 RepID=UPI0012DD714F|nr:hypothetical protein [Streptomonospora sp. PA3]MUL43215.1 hypothetical protein [Streptomonospora sp. PA3]
MSAASTRRPLRGATTGPAVLAELHKLATVRSTWWFTGGAAAAMLAIALLASDDGDPATALAVPIATQAVSNFVQFILGALGIVGVTGEFASRSITVTFACTPSRTRVMVAKALVVGGAVFAAGFAVAALGVGVAAVRFDEAAGIGAAEAADVAAMGLYLALLAMLGLGLGTLVRRTAGALAILVVLLVMVPELLGFAARKFGLAWLETAADYTPAPAGWQLMSGRWEYALVLLAWGGGAVAAGAWALKVRDV